MLEYHSFAGLGYLYAALGIAFICCLIAARAITISERRK